MSIILFSRPVHSGKTTELMQYCVLRTGVHGILMPDINGTRKLMNIATKEIFDIECKDPLNTNEHLTTVGRFSFYTLAFEKANIILLNALPLQPALLVIDEAGKLELEGKGFHNPLQKILPAYKNNDNRRLLVTVRDSLLEKFIAYFEIGDHRQINNLSALK
jgi:nucleoside-triphosphatase THEP1